MLVSIKHDCSTCHYNFQGEVCGNHASDNEITDLYGYDTSIIRKNCNGWRISFSLFQKTEIENEMTYGQLIKERLMEIADLMGMDWDKIDCELHMKPKDLELEGTREIDLKARAKG